MAKREPIAIVAIVKNESRLIFEWLAHHRSIGVDHFVIYDNASTDGTRDEIRSFPDQACITLIDWPMTFGQMPAYEDAIARFGTRFDWMAFIDADEFLIPMRDETLGDILADFPTADGLAVPWTLFGSNGHDRRPDGLVLANYTRRADLAFDVNRHIKCIMRPRTIAYVTTSSHIFISRNGSIQTEDGRQVDHQLSLLPEPFLPERLRLHHYAVQSREDFDLKAARGVANPSQPRTASFFDYHDRNEVLDLTALRFVPAIEAWQNRRGAAPPRKTRRGWATLERLFSGRRPGRGRHG